MNIAIVGSGISGLVAAHLLGGVHDITLFESDDRLGGHTNTVTVEDDIGPLAIDTGFIVFNDWTYPNFIGLLNELGVESVATSMGFSVQCQRCGLEYAGASIATLFAQKRNLVRPSFYRLLSDIVRFNRLGSQRSGQLSETTTVGEFLDEHRFSPTFSEHYLLPMGAAIWSCPMSTFREFPIRFIIEFYRNHGLLSIQNRPTWQTITGGSRTYIRRIIERFPGTVRLSTAVHRVDRNSLGVTLHHQHGSETFDEVILACHSDQALRLLGEPTPTENELLSAFPYSQNVAVLHTDASILPTRRSVWSSWNYRIPNGPESRPMVTYNMNILQRLDPLLTRSDRTYCVTLNAAESINPDHHLRTFQYSHPIFTTQRASAQERHHELIRRKRTSYCGAYWGNGFHEDGVNSALAVCEQFGIRPHWSHRPHAPLNSHPPTVLSRGDDD
ncbi:MAG: FAD-dependent oxidoreductase [Planctomycetaceae bacterium]